jgi:hypothetical protein
MYKLLVLIEKFSASIESLSITSQVIDFEDKDQRAEAIIAINEGTKFSDFHIEVIPL